MEEVVELLASRYRQETDDQEDIDDRMSYIKSMMISPYIKVYMIYDACAIMDQDEWEYILIAAFLIEEKVEYKNGQDCAFIQILATEFGFERHHHIKTLLFTVFSQSHLREKHVVFVNRFGKDNMRLVEEKIQTLMC